MNVFKTSSFLLFVLLLSVGSCTGQSLESREVKNLTAFAKLYGYVKYFHPSDEAREIDWDKLAVLGAKKVKKGQYRQGTEKDIGSVILADRSDD